MSVPESAARIAEDVRLRFEAEHGDGSGMPDFDRMCRPMSHELCAGLVAAGFPARTVPGQYVGMSEDYAPDTSDWDPEDAEAYAEDPSISHWWVRLGDDIIDICADQFHPEDRTGRRIVFTEATDQDYQAWRPETRDALDEIRL